MGIHVHWYLPTNGDSRDIVGSRHPRITRAGDHWEITGRKFYATG